MLLHGQSNVCKVATITYITKSLQKLLGNALVYLKLRLEHAKIECHLDKRLLQSNYR